MKMTKSPPRIWGPAKTKAPARSLPTCQQCPRARGLRGLNRSRNGREISPTIGPRKKPLPKAGQGDDVCKDLIY